MNAVFLDTVGLIALWDEADQWHDAAERAFSQLVAARRAFVTTTFIFLECGNTAARRPYRTRVCGLRQKMEQRGDVIIPTAEDWRIAWENYEKGEAAEAGIVDHVSFVVMQRLGVTEAFTNDKHFQAAGFTALF